MALGLLGHVAAKNVRVFFHRAPQKSCPEFATNLVPLVPRKVRDHEDRARRRLVLGVHDLTRPAARSAASACTGARTSSRTSSRMEGGDVGSRQVAPACWKLPVRTRARGEHCEAHQQQASHIRPDTAAGLARSRREPCPGHAMSFLGAPSQQSTLARRVFLRPVLR